MVAELLPQRLLGLGTREVSQRCVDALPLLLRMRRGAARSWKSGARRRGLGTVRWVPRRHAAVLPHHEYPIGVSGAEMGWLTHWSHPGGGTSSSGISTTAT
jgi:hypothetical protein